MSNLSAGFYVVYLYICRKCFRVLSKYSRRVCHRSKIGVCYGRNADDVPTPDKATCHLPYYPATKITHITVGAEVTKVPNNVSAMEVPAMQNVLTALREAGLHKKIKVSTTHSLGVLSQSYPPSAGAFNGIHSSSNVSLDYALFEPSSEVIDPNTGLVYTNMFDAQRLMLFTSL
ncbi:glucan endo-1,3-beta-glucosidase 13-like [Coffea arabica]|uniref:Glucan endo-1,3-beta-glucosidase 13-like n=1 Tax=Coffea arabica TaxID=13443 RepID=A0ABM4VGQ4_COFAR